MRIRIAITSVLLVALSAVTVTASAQQSAEPASEGKASSKQFFRGLGKKLEQATGITLVNTGATAARGAGPLYEPLGSGSTLEGLFTHGNRDLALQGQLEWPRVALTFLEYGRSVPCWTVEARIWTNATTSTTEKFKTCLNAPLTTTDDLGNSVAYNKHDGLTRAKLRRFLDLQPLYGYVDTTGTKRTTGPNPPRQLFGVNVPAEIEEKVNDAALNSMWISGFFGPENTGMAASFMDWRMWIAGFDPAGNRDK